MEAAVKMRQSNRFPFEPTDKYRKQLNAVERDTILIPTREGACTTYVFRSRHRESPAPLVVYLHGGGFVMERTERDDLCAARIAALTGGIVLDIDYSLSPEHVFLQPSMKSMTL